MTPLLAWCVSLLPSAVLTETVVGLTTVPSPLIHVILFFLKRNSTPLEFWRLTARERFIAGLRSNWSGPVVIP